ncbi:MAG: hypothetical protein COA78_25805 [Blastopirellula sp.]|nr:MAG: hypothetical protein COA78_25805 [Blastopirellula sp.]
MPTFAFWNVNKNVSAENISAFAHERDVDILVLAENEIPVSKLVSQINTKSNRPYFQDIMISDRLTIFTRFQPGNSSLIQNKPGVVIRHYQMPLGESFLVVAVHLSSKLRKKTEDQSQSCARLARYINKAEAKVGHTRTVVIGDLNMNPFEYGVVGSEGLHAVMDRRIAERGSRTLHEEERPFFYNPMWSTLGDLDSKPPGTYYYDNGSEVNYYWHAFDQVLIRPALLDFMPHDAMKVITELKGQSLLTEAGRPNKKMSDHLPIVCHLNEIMEKSNAN